MLHDVEVPQLHDLLLTLVDVGEVLDLLQREKSDPALDFLKVNPGTQCPPPVAI